MEYNPGKNKQEAQPLMFKRGDTPEFRFTVIRDTREQLPWEFKDFEVRDQAVEVGDYTIGFKFEGRMRTMDRIFVVERKGSASEMVSMVGQERERFQRELAKLRFIEHPFIICEFTLEDFMREAMMSGLNPASAFGSIIAWQKYMPVILAGNREFAKESFLVLARMYFKRYVLCHRRGKLTKDLIEEEQE